MRYKDRKNALIRAMTMQKALENLGTEVPGTKGQPFDWPTLARDMDKGQTRSYSIMSATMAQRLRQENQSRHLKDFSRMQRLDHGLVGRWSRFDEGEVIALKGSLTLPK
ncbi:hypothetical protein ACFL2M_00455 [Patescibacteria group bacterium]